MPNVSIRKVSLPHPQMPQNLPEITNIISRNHLSIANINPNNSTNKKVNYAKNSYKMDSVPTKRNANSHMVHIN